MQLVRVERRLTRLDGYRGGRVERAPEVTYTGHVSAYPDLPDDYGFQPHRTGPYSTEPDPVSPVTLPVAVTPHVTPSLSSAPAQVPPWWETPDSGNGNQAVGETVWLGTAVATTPTEADETSPEKSRGEKSGSHVD